MGPVGTVGIVVKQGPVGTKVQARPHGGNLIVETPRLMKYIVDKLGPLCSGQAGPGRVKRTRQCGLVDTLGQVGSREQARPDGVQCKS